MNTKEKTFYIIPVLALTKVTNTLTKEARRDFHSNWNYYYKLKIGWLWFSKELAV